MARNLKVKASLSPADIDSLRWVSCRVINGDTRFNTSSKLATFILIKFDRNFHHLIEALEAADDRLHVGDDLKSNF